MTQLTEIKASLSRTIELAQAATPGEWMSYASDGFPVVCERNGAPGVDAVASCKMNRPKEEQCGNAAHIANACNTSERSARALLAAIEHNEECLKSFNPNIKADATVCLEAIIAAWQEAWQ